MKKFWRIVSIALICGTLITPQTEARGRNNNTSSSNQSNQLGQRPNASNNNNAPKPGGNSNNAPKPGGNNNAPKPGGNNNAPKPGGNNNAPKPGGNNNNAPKPGGNNHNAPKPGGNNNNAPKPGGNHNNTPKPGGNHNNTPKPGGNHNNAPKPGGNKNNPPKPGGNKNGHHGSINRPHCPPPAPYRRPTPPPPTYRPSKGAPSFRAIFGITLGSTINISLDYLYRNSYNINGYGNDVIYLRNVTEYGYMWPDATLYYESNRLVGSQLMYSTNYNSHSRYNMVYNTLTNQYGNPIDIQYISNGMVATWWGYNGQYITLEYHPVYTNNGQLRYLTTLSFGM